MKFLNRPIAIAFIASVTLTLSQGVVFGSIHTVNFTRVTSNAPLNVESQFVVEVLDQAGVTSQGYLDSSNTGITLSAGQVLFVIRNNGPIASDLTEFYFHRSAIGGPATSLDSIYNSVTGAGVTTSFTTFHPGVTPPNLPGAPAGFTAVGTLSADSDNPGPAADDGVNPVEAFAIAYTITGGFSGVVDALDDGTIRLGFHVRSIDGGTSDSFVNTTTVIPEPATLLVWSGLGLTGLVFGYRKVRRVS